MSKMIGYALWRLLKVGLLSNIFISILLSAVWLVLPCPPVPDEDRALYIQNTLAAGKTVVAALSPEAFKRSNQKALAEDWCADCTSVLFHWQFLSSDGKTDILVAPHKPDNYWALERPFRLSHNLAAAKEWNERKTGRSDTWSPYFARYWGPPLPVPAGRMDEHISQGWFPEVDRHLIYYTMIRQTTDVDLRVAIPVPGIVEFWRGAAVDAAFNATSDGWADLLNKADIFDSADRTPAIYEWMRKNEDDIDLVASFKSNGPGIEDIIVQELKGNLPSRTWAFRQMLITMCTRCIVGPVQYFKDIENLLLPRWSGLAIF